MQLPPTFMHSIPYVIWFIFVDKLASAWETVASRLLRRGLRA